MSVVEIVSLVWQILGPLATKMVERMLDGGDPLDVLARDNVEDVLGPELLSEIALRRAQAARTPSGGV